MKNLKLINHQISILFNKKIENHQFWKAEKNSLKTIF